MAEKRRILVLYGSLLVLLLAAVWAGLAFGSTRLAPGAVLQALQDGTGPAAVIVGKLRLPRVLAAIIAGAALAAAGTLLQCVTNNQLCAPNIIGINAGAGFGVMLVLCLAPFAWRLLPLAAFIGALLTTGVVMGIAFRGGSRTHGTAIVLSGVAVSSVLNAGISFLSLRFPEVLSSYTAFRVGGFAGVSPRQLALPAILVAAALLVAQLLAPRLNLLCLGDEIAASLGIRVRLLRIGALVTAAALCAAAVSFAGLLGFVGLIVPHMVRQLAGSDLRFTLSLSALAGAILVIASDLVGRVAFAPSELPAGMLLSLLGAPFFLYLLMKRRHGYARM